MNRPRPWTVIAIAAAAWFAVALWIVRARALEGWALRLVVSASAILAGVVVVRLLVPERRRLQLRIALCSAALVTAIVNVALGWTSDVPRVAVIVTFVSLLVALVNDVLRLREGPEPRPGETTQ